MKAGCTQTLCAALLFTLLLLLFAGASVAQVPAAALPQVRFEARAGTQVPPDLSFTDGQGTNVPLRSLFGARPVILVLIRYGCDRICPELLNGVVHALQPLDLLPGRDYDWAVVSLDPAETPFMAGLKKHEYLERYAHPGGAQGWHFLVGGAEADARLADAVGCRYFYDARTASWAEPMGMVLLTPDGRVSSYLFGTSFDSETLRRRLATAAAGGLGPEEAGAQVRCYTYDPTATRLGSKLVRAVRVGAAANVLALAGLLGWLVQSDRRRGRGSAS